MSRSGYSDDYDDTWAMIRWRGAVKSAIRGRVGQAFLREMITALDAMPEKRLAANVLIDDCGVCAMGAVVQARGLDFSGVDPYDRHAVANLLKIADALAAEIAYENDQPFDAPHETPEQRWTRMRAWAESLIVREIPNPW